MSKRLVVATHIFVRWLADFGNIVTYLHKEGYGVTICTSPPLNLPYLNWDDPQMFEEYRSLLPASTDIEILPFQKGRIDLRAVFRMTALASRLARHYPDGLFMLWHMVIIVAMGLPLRVMNRKCLFMVTGLGSVLGGETGTFKWQRAIALPIYRFLFSGRNSRVLTHNVDDKQFLVERTGVDPSKVVVTPGCGVDPAVFPFFEEMPGNDPPVILVPARLIHQKGILDACAASKSLDTRGVRHELWLTGGLEPFYPQISISGTELEELRRSTPSARFIGYAKSLVPIYRQCDIVCYPTRYPEGLPTALVEAAACGRPVVTTDNVGCRDITVDGQTGLVVPVHDAVALANALERLIRDVPLRDRLRRNAYSRFRTEFTKDIVLQRTLAAFESMGNSFSGDRAAPDIRAPYRRTPEIPVM